MVKVINYALGSKDYFHDEMGQHPDRPLILAKNMTTQASYILLDLSDQPSFFGSSIKLNVINHVGNDNIDKFIFLQAFDLDKENREMLNKIAPNVLDNSLQNFSQQMEGGYYCQREDHPQTMVMVTTWRSHSDLDKWLTSSCYAPLKEYTNQRLLNFTEVFKVVKDN